MVLVDCDLHRPAVHRMFDGERAPGLTDYFEGGAALDEVIHIDRTSGLNYIPVGAASSREAWRITEDRMRPLIARLRLKYGFIILELGSGACRRGDGDTVRDC